MGYYQDLRQYINALEQNGKLIRIKEPINKETQLMPLVRWQFRGLPENERKAFLFERVIDAKGKEYQMPVLVGALAGSREIYALGMQCRIQDIAEKWAQAQREPLLPILVDNGPVQEVVMEGDELQSEGVTRLPIPVSTPGFDNAPYSSAAYWVSKDPDTGGRNLGNYRCQLKGPTRMGINHSPTQHIGQHWRKYKAMGKPMPVAVVIGGAPNIGYVAVSKIPYGIDEYAVAGGIAGEPVALVRCRTVDLEVPATAEIVVEGYLSTDYAEPEGPHGEYTGYVGPRRMFPFMDVTCITHRRDAIYTVIISQFPPSESSKIRQIGTEGVYFKFLRHDCNIPNIMDVAFLESGGAAQYCVIRMRKTHPSQPWQALHCASGLSPQNAKYIVVVDEDIDPWDSDSVNWALSFRTRPEHDIEIVRGQAGGIDPACAIPGYTKEEADYPMPRGNSGILIDATRKFPYPPVSLPRREYMEQSKLLWEKLGLPALDVKTPWHGYTLGDWTQQDEEEAALAVQGEYLQTGAKVANQRKKL